MREREWQDSEDLYSMLDYLGEGVSNRKLLLWVEACRTAANPARVWREISKSDNIRVAAQDWCHQLSGWETTCPVSTRARLLRDIIGNPFRPAVLPKSWAKCSHCNGKGWTADTSNQNLGIVNCGCDKGRRLTGPCPWLTPAVLSLAKAAYKDRDPATGRLDPQQLSILADALEEEGCSGKDVVEVVEYCNAFMFGCEEFDAMDTCTHKVKKEVRRFEPHPLLAHLRSPGPHVRGCWAVDAVLGLG